MSLSFLDRYIWEAEAHANELLELLDPDRREALADLLERHWQALLPDLLAPPKTAFVFLGEDPSRQEARLARLPARSADLLWAQARFLALRAASSLRQASVVANVKGMKYRAAVRHAAQAISPPLDLPAPQDIALLRLPC